MSVYTVYEPPLRAGEATPDPERFVFVRDGFSFWGFLLGPLWMLWHRMWIVLLGYLVLAAALGWAHKATGAALGIGAAVTFLIMILIGCEAGTLRRFTLERRGWRNLGIVVGDDLELAERRFFDAWTGAHGKPPSADATPPAPPGFTGPYAPGAHAQPGSSDVLGLFPEPKASP
jgi:Protein of unknown function (DUF2628)